MKSPESTKEGEKLHLLGERDELFDSGPYPVPFCFNEDVASVFDDMVVRSIPMYRETILTLVRWVRRYYRPTTKVYDLGCSTGTTLRALHDYGPVKLETIGIDDSQAMLDKAAIKLDEEIVKSKANLICADLREARIENASIVVMNYTLQFLPVRDRLPLLKSIYDGLAPGGILFLSEKVQVPDPQLHESMTGIYESFKLANGYKSNEIERKKEALDQVLVPFTVEEQEDALVAAGFAASETILRWHNFLSIVAIKKDGLH